MAVENDRTALGKSDRATDPVRLHPQKGLAMWCMAVAKARPAHSEYHESGPMSVWSSRGPHVVVSRRRATPPPACLFQQREAQIDEGGAVMSSRQRSVRCSASLWATADDRREPH